MPFEPLGVVEQDAPEKISRRELDDYKAHLLTLNPGKRHLIYVYKGEPVMRKVKAVDDKGNTLTQLDPKTGKYVPLYAVVNGDPQPSGQEGVEYVMEDTGRGKLESKDASGLVAAGAEENISVNVKATQLGRGTVTRVNGRDEFQPDANAQEITLLTLFRSNPRNDTPEGTLQKKIGLSDNRAKRAEEQLARATNASESFKQELQDKIEKYKAESKQASLYLKQLREAKTPEIRNRVLVKAGFKPDVDESSTEEKAS